MKRFLFTSLALALSMSMATPGFAYIFGGTSDIVRQSKRTTMHNQETYGKSDLFRTAQKRRRREAVEQATGRMHLQSATMERRLRRMNRMPKPGSDRYRVLNRLKPNSRSIRQESMLQLPQLLIQTGGDQEPHGRPSQRSVEDAAAAQWLNDRP